MIKQALTRTLMLLVFCFSANLMAESDGDWSVKVEVLSIESKGDGDFLLVTSPSAPESCQSIYRVYKNQFGLTQDAAKQHLSLSLAALTAGKKIQVKHSGQNECFVKNIIFHK